MGLFPNKERATAGTRMHDSCDVIGSRPRRCVVVGASVRGFVESAARRGWSVHAADLYGDGDLVASAVETVRLAAAGGGYPAGIPGAVADFPAAPLAYTGGLENHPAVIEVLARDRPLAGCGPAALTAVRDPARLDAVLRDAGLRMPDTFRSPAGLPCDGSFLVKPLASAGGRGIAAWRGIDARATEIPLVWQRRVRGAEWSASFVAGGGRAILVGVSRPVPGSRWCGCGEFAYCGSLNVPLDSIPDAMRHGLDTLVTALAAGFPLIGLCGADLIVDHAGTMHVLEVNPRPTASMELIERATGWSPAAAHFAAFGLDDDPPHPGAGGCVWAKAVAYAPRRRAANPAADAVAALDDRWRSADGRRALADVPAPGSTPAAGAPLMTVFARGESPAAAVATLRRRVLELRRACVGVSRPAAAAARTPRGRTP